jgi:hypothetical protein
MNKETAKRITDTLTSYLETMYQARHMTPDSNYIHVALTEKNIKNLAYARWNQYPTSTNYKFKDYLANFRAVLQSSGGQSFPIFRDTGIRRFVNVRADIVPEEK